MLTEYLRRTLDVGGLVRSVGRWSALKSLRKAGAFQKGDERILGYGEFVEKVLCQAKEAFERKYRLKARAIDVGRIAERIADVMGMAPEAVWAPGKQPGIVRPAAFFVAGRRVNLKMVRRG